MIRERWLLHHLLIDCRQARSAQSFPRVTYVTGLVSALAVHHSMSLMTFAHVHQAHVPSLVLPVPTPADRDTTSESFGPNAGSSKFWAVCWVDYESEIRRPAITSGGARLSVPTSMWPWRESVSTGVDYATERASPSVAPLRLGLRPSWPHSKSESRPCTPAIRIDVSEDSSSGTDSRTETDVRPSTKQKASDDIKKRVAVGPESPYRSEE